MTDEGRSIRERWLDVWEPAAPSSRRAWWLAVAALLTTGAPILGLIIAIIAIVASRAARADDRDEAGDPGKLATLSMLLAVLSVILSGGFTAALLALLSLG